MSTQTTLTGGCLCRGLRYTITLPSSTHPPDHIAPTSLLRGTHCHCGQCRKTHGALFATYLTLQNPRDHFRWDNKETYVEYQSSECGRRGFCGRCGGSVIWRWEKGDVEAAGQGEEVDVSAGSLDEEVLLRGTEGKGKGVLGCVNSSLWCRNCVPGVDDLVGLGTEEAGKRFLESRSSQVLPVKLKVELVKDSSD